MSPEEKERVRVELIKKLRKVFFLGIFSIVFLMFFTRRNHKYYVYDGGMLVPVEFEGPNGVIHNNPQVPYNPYQHAQMPIQLQ